jgi:hypothetical protein
MSINSITDSTTAQGTPTVGPQVTHKTHKSGKHHNADHSSPAVAETETKGTTGVNIDTQKVPESKKEESVAFTKPSVNKYV